MRTFPLELVQEVIGHLDQLTVLSCSLVSKTYRNAAFPIMWRVLVIRRIRGAPRKLTFEYISTVTHISKFVREINFDMYIAQALSIKLECIPKALAQFHFFPNFKNLTTLRLLFPERSMEDFYRLPSLDKYDRDWSSSPYRRLQSDAFGMLARVHLATGFHVNTLELHRLFAFPNAGIHAQGLQSFLSPVKTLYVSLLGVGSDESPEYDAWELYDRFMEDLMVIFKAPQALESFTYIGDRFAHGMSAMQWDQLTYPKLKHIRLEDIIFGSMCILGTAQSEEHQYSCFILRHNATLETLVLRNCVRHVSAEPTNNIGCITWAHLFRCFHDELGNLLSFNIDPLPGRNDERDDDFFGCYMCYNDQGGYKTHFCTDPVDQVKDRVALMLLKETVEERRKRSGRG